MMIIIILERPDVWFRCKKHTGMLMITIFVTKNNLKIIITMLIAP